MKEPGEDGRFEELARLVEEEKRDALSAFDPEAFARRVRRTVAAPAPARSAWAWPRPALAGAFAAVLLAAALAALWSLRGSTRPDPRTVEAALRRCPYFAAVPGPMQPARAADDVRVSDLEWALRALVYRAERSCDSCPASGGDVVTALAVALGGPAPGGRAEEWGAVSSPDLARRLDALSRSGTLARVLAPAS